MKKSIVSLLLCVGMVAAVAQPKEDIQSIKEFCGCFDIQFKYAETFPEDSNYKLSKPYLASGREWVEIIEEKPGKLVLQHLLIVDTMIIKHWREDWTYQNTTLLNYNGGAIWKKSTLDPQQVKGQWTQSVWEVNDAPRYQGSATWIHADGKHYWQNNTDAPLPRREYSKRDDYNVMNRTNTLHLTADGWIHEQDNKKIIREEGKKDSLLVMEKGYNIYTRTEASKCDPAKAWWGARKNNYTKVRKDWDEKIAKAAKEVSL